MAKDVVMFKRSAVFGLVLMLTGVLAPIHLCAAEELSASEELAESDNQFAFDLYSRYAPTDGNIFFSPYSLSSALGMTFEGARGNTAEEMRAVLHLSGDDSARRAAVAEFIQTINAPGKRYEISVANALWAQDAYPFSADYLKLVTDVYSAAARNLDFASDPDGSRLTINSWVSDKTRTRIRDLLPPATITGMTRLVLTNAVYFKGKWPVPFDKEATQPQEFWLDPKKNIQADMMTRRDHFSYMEDEAIQMIELPYEGADLSLIVLLPRIKNGHALDAELSLKAFRKWSEKLESQDVILLLPKFGFDKRYEMRQALADLGMPSAFSDADFSGMTGGRDLKIDEVIHKAWVEVNEEGTEAAAATAIEMAPTSAGPREPPPEPKVFRADHPFVFMIKDTKSGSILFIGRVMDPRK
jgi:serpin B